MHSEIRIMYSIQTKGFLQLIAKAICSTYFLYVVKELEHDSALVLSKAEWRKA